MPRRAAISLPWPPSELSPNSRKDRRHTTDKRRAYRDAGFFLIKEAGVTVPEGAHLDITFYPPDRRKRDLDNMLGAIKYGLDGIAKASGVDDYGWSMTISRGVPVKGGEVHIQFNGVDK